LGEGVQRLWGTKLEKSPKAIENVEWNISEISVGEKMHEEKK